GVAFNSESCSMISLFTRHFFEKFYFVKVCVTQVPFPLLQGECVERVGRAEESVIALTSYRLHIKLQENLINVPLQLIESVECRDLTQLHLTCKDCKLIRYVCFD
uniref:Uncharacterized protein n=1 Tax=Sinocyclocheilus grahami TaxID=75366 RepID=A0A672SRM2_SINGR